MSSEEAPAIRAAVCSMVLGDTPEAQKEYMDQMKDNIQSHIEYCMQHKYDYICAQSLEQISERALTEPARPLEHYKILLLQRLVEQYDYIMWLDADTKIQNPIPMVNIARGYMGSHHAALIGITDLEVVCPHTGVMILHKTPLTKPWLETIWRTSKPDMEAIPELFRKSYNFASRVSLIPATIPILQCFPCHNLNQLSLTVHYTPKLRAYMPMSKEEAN